MKLSRFLIAIPLALSICTVGCKGKSKTTHIDYVEQTHIGDYSQLTTYEGVNFLDNGIGQVTLYNPVDGDTAHFFQTKESDTKERLVKVRFFGIDTPESTGQIEPWGKKASKFTSDKLKSAKTIVLTNGSLLGVPAEVDSTGSRFKGLVWVSEKENAPLNELKCLNLWIVQEGFSNAKGATDCPLVDVFSKADMQAQQEKIGIWSGDDPDFYTGDAIKTSIKEIMDEFILNKGSAPTYEGKKVQINGIVSKVVDDDAYVIQDFENEETGNIERYGMFIFAGYKNYAALKTVGNDLTIIGTFTVRYGNPQITSVSYNPYLPSKDDMVINGTGMEKPYEDLTFDEIDGNYRYVNVVANFRNLRATGKGSNSIDKTTGNPSGALSIQFQDNSGHKLYLRVPKNVWLMEKDAGPLDRVTDYAYMYNNGNPYTIDLTAAIAIYDPNNQDDDGEGSDPYWQMTLCSKDDVTYK